MNPHIAQGPCFRSVRMRAACDCPTASHSSSRGTTVHRNIYLLDTDLASSEHVPEFQAFYAGGGGGGAGSLGGGADPGAVGVEPVAPGVPVAGCAYPACA